MLRQFILVFGVLFPGMIFMLIALLLVNVTVIGDYRDVLALAFLFMVLANVCFGVLLWQRFAPWRLCALLAWLPSLYVLGELLRRAPYVYFR